MKLFIPFLLIFSVSTNAFAQATSVAPAPVAPPRPAGITNEFSTSNPAPPSPTVAPAVAEAPTNTSTDLSFWEKFKKAPISLFVDSDFAGSNSNGSYIGYRNVSNVYLTYKFSTEDSFRVNTGYALSDDNSTNLSADYDGTTLMYRRSGILTEEKHGVSLRSEVRLNLLPSNPSYSATTSLRVAGSKSFGAKYNLYTELRWNEYVRKSGTPSSTRRSFLLLASPSYNITDKLSLAGTTIFSQAIKSLGVNYPNEINFAPAVSYGFTEKFNASVYWDTYPFTSNDGHMFAPDWAKNGGLGLYVSYTIL